jgi:CO/xanthine dehydrogenase FAD-binding subunit
MAVEVRSVATIAEAAQALRADRRAKLLGGGTLLMRDVNEGRLLDAVLLRLTDPALRAVRVGGARIELGAGVTMAQVLAQRDLAMLHPAARAIGGPAVRAMATVGGNLFAPAPYGDMAVALLALDAVATVHSGAGGERQVPLDALLRERERGVGGIVASLAFARPAAPEAFRYVKVSRVRPKGISVLSIAAHLPQSGARISGARIALGAMAPAPMRARGVERALEGRALDEASVTQALARAVEDIAPATDAIATAWYRREVLPVHLGRLLRPRGAA